MYREVSENYPGLTFWEDIKLIEKRKHYLRLMAKWLSYITQVPQVPKSTLTTSIPNTPTRSGYMRASVPQTVCVTPELVI